MHAFLFIACAIAQTPTPTGTKDVVVAQYFSQQSAMAVALVGSCEQSIYVSSWRLTDGTLCAALAAAASGSVAIEQYTSTATNTFTGGLTLHVPTPTSNCPTSGTLSMTMTGASTTVYGPITYNATSPTATPAPGQLAADPSFTDLLTEASTDTPLNVVLNQSHAPVNVYVTWDTSTGTKNPAYAATRGITAAGGTCVMSTFPHLNANNFVVGDSNYTLTGSYYYRPEAVQIGSYSWAISGTSQALQKQELWTTLTSSGTVTADVLRRPAAAPRPGKAIKCNERSTSYKRQPASYRLQSKTWNRQQQVKKNRRPNPRTKPTSPAEKNPKLAPLIDDLGESRTQDAATRTRARHAMTHAK
jgi:hypothetical protein